MNKPLLIAKFLTLGLTSTLYGQICGTDELQQDIFRLNPQLKMLSLIIP